MHVLITGGAGFIGSHTADALLKRGDRVRVLDSLEEPIHPGGRKPSYLDGEAELIIGDVRDERVLLNAMRGCDAIYHFAAFQDYLPTFSKFFDVNATSTALIYELIAREKLSIQKVIVASSQAALGEGSYQDARGETVLPGLRSNEQLQAGLWEIQPRQETGEVGPLRWLPTPETVANPQNPYGMSKIAEEQIALNLGRRCQIPSVALRYSIVQGPRQSFYNAYSGACRVFCLSFHLGRDPVIFEDGKQVRDFVNIQDVVDGNLLVLDDPRADYEMFNVGGDKVVEVAEFAQVVSEVFEVEDFKSNVSGKYRFGDTRHIFSDITKLRNLGWIPKRTVRDSVVAYRTWLEGCDVKDDILDYCNREMEKLGVVRNVTS
jgi:dTDP-L-rhamnose 4-epimerase